MKFSTNEEDNIINETYYEDIALKGTRPEVQAHAAPESYGLTREDAIKARLRYLRHILKKEECTFNLCQHVLLTNYSEWTELQLVESGKQLDMIRNKIKNESNRLKFPGRKAISYDIAAIKKIPINELVEVNSTGFFKVRNEKTPSCKWYRTENRWQDFGSGTGGDVIDLYAIINNCDTKTAMKELSSLI